MMLDPAPVATAFCRQAYRRSDGRSPMGRSALRTSARKSSTRNGSNFRPAPQPAGLLRCVAPPPAAAPIGPTRDRFSLALAEFVTGSCSTSPHKCVSVGCTWLGKTGAGEKPAGTQDQVQAPHCLLPRTETGVAKQFLRPGCRVHEYSALSPRDQSALSRTLMGGSTPPSRSKPPRAATPRVVIGAPAAGQPAPDPAPSPLGVLRMMKRCPFASPAPAAASRVVARPLHLSLSLLLSSCRSIGPIEQRMPRLTGQARSRSRRCGR